MKQRIISAFVGVIVLVLVLLGNQYVFDIAVTLISMVAVFEVLNALGLSRFKGMTGVSLIFPAVLTLLSYQKSELYVPVLFVFASIFMLCMLFNHNECTFDITSKFITVIIFIPLCFIHVTMTRRLGFENLDVLVILLGCWITDSCAYFAGYFLGKHKLAPEISPKKTIEGSIGGIVGVSVIMTAYAAIAANIMGLGVNLISAAIVGIICGLLSQCGDLCASIIKREHGIKDFGNIMPGHGGVMDRFDSLLFVAPVVYYILYYFPIFIK